METPVSHVVDHQRQVLGFMLDTLGLRHAHDDATRRARIDELERAVAALGTENRALRSQIRELERELCPEAAEIDDWEREVESRIAHEREAERI